MILPLTSLLILMNTFTGVGIEETPWSATQELTPEGVSGRLPVTKPPQDIYINQRNNDRNRANQARLTQIAELLGQQEQARQQQEDDQPSLQVNQRHRVRVRQPGPTEWRQDWVGHFYRQVYDDITQQWYIQWWDFSQGRAYRVLSDDYGRNYTAWV